MDIKKYFNFELKPIQNKIIKTVINATDCIALLPTGYGKSVTFQIPALILSGITLVISPLIALMEDQVRNLKRKGIKALCINSNQDDELQAYNYNLILGGSIKLVYVSAERLQNKTFLRVISKVKIDLFVCDEAHTLSWSEGFRAALGEIPLFFERIGYQPTILALTATANGDMVSKITSLLSMKNPIIYTALFDKSNIYYRVIKTSNKLKVLLDYLKKNNSKGLIYCLTIKTCELLYSELKRLGFRVGLYHGMLQADVKVKMQTDYANDKLKYLICTNAFGMGIDIAGIRFVVVYEICQSIEDFVQQTGRASRDGLYAEAILLFNKTDINTNHYFIESIKDKDDKKLGQIKKQRYQKFNKMLDFCFTKKCLHQFISKYLNQQIAECRCMCYNCQKKYKN